MSKKTDMIGGTGEQICLCGRKNNLTKVFELNNPEPIYVCCSLCYKLRKTGVELLGDFNIENHDSKCYKSNYEIENYVTLKQCPTCLKMHNDYDVCIHSCCKSCKENKKIMNKILHDTRCPFSQYCVFCGMNSNEYRDEIGILQKDDKYAIICCSRCCETDGRVHTKECKFTRTFGIYHNTPDNRDGVEKLKAHILSKTEGKEEEVLVHGKYIPPGLSNINANSCFINSALQLIYRMTFLRNYFYKQDKYKSIEKIFNKIDDRENIYIYFKSDGYIIDSNKKNEFFKYLRVLKDMYNNQFINTSRKLESKITGLCIIDPPIVNTHDINYDMQHDPSDAIEPFLNEVIKSDEKNLNDLYDTLEVFGIDDIFTIEIDKKYKYFILRININENEKCIDYDLVISHEINNYKLVGVIVHFGFQNAGHYNIYLNYYDEWYLYDDNNIIKIDDFNTRFDFSGININSDKYIEMTIPVIFLYEKIV